MRAARPARRAASGQSLAEFALILPTFLLILFSIIQFGFLLGSQIGLTNGVREAARYAVTQPRVTSAQVLTELTTRSLPRSIPAFTAGRVVGAQTQVQFCYVRNPNDSASFPSYSRRVRVIATYSHPLFVPLVTQIVDAIDGTADGSLTARVTEEMRLETTRLTTTGGLPLC